MKSVALDSVVLKDEIYSDSQVSCQDALVEGESSNMMLEVVSLLRMH